jgi:hypothetical protein
MSMTQAECFAEMAVRARAEARQIADQYVGDRDPKQLAALADDLELRKDVHDEGRDMAILTAAELRLMAGRAAARRVAAQ